VPGQLADLRLTQLLRYKAMPRRCQAHIAVRSGERTEWAALRQPSSAKGTAVPVKASGDGGVSAVDDVLGPVGMGGRRGPNDEAEPLAQAEARISRAP
jgi:hypothetical protein